MSDIVERLRESVRACRALDRSALLEEAADEIERLRSRVVRLPQPLVLHGDLGGEFARGEAWMLSRVQAALDAAGVAWEVSE